MTTKVRRKLFAEKAVSGRITELLQSLLKRNNRSVKNFFY